MSAISAKTAIKGRPVIFGAESVRAIIEGRKTQTRRVVKPQPIDGQGWYFWPEKPDLEERTTAKVMWTANMMRQGLEALADFCPYGKPGERLWVRETWAEAGDGGAVWFKAGVPIYRAGRWNGGWEAYNPQMGLPVPEDIRWSSPIHMPRWASRITLEITTVRVERLQDITGNDAREEGVCDPDDTTPRSGLCRIGQFREGWDALNAARGFGWDNNPWVWVLQFKRIGMDR